MANLNFTESVTNSLGAEKLADMESHTSNMLKELKGSRQAFEKLDIEMSQNNELLSTAAKSDAVLEAMLDQLKGMRDLDGKSSKEQKVGLAQLKVIREEINNNNTWSSEIKDTMQNYSGRINEGLQSQSGILQTIQKNAVEHVDKIGFGVSAAMGNSPLGLALSGMVSSQIKAFLERRRAKKEAKKDFHKIKAIESKQLDVLEDMHQTMVFQSLVNISSKMSGFLGTIATGIGSLIGLFAAKKGLDVAGDMAGGGAGKKGGKKGGRFSKALKGAKSIGGRALGALGPVAAVAGAGYAGYQAGSYLNEKFLTNEDGSGKIANAAYNLLHGDDEKKQKAKADAMAQKRGFKDFSAMQASNKAKQQNLSTSTSAKTMSVRSQKTVIMQESQSEIVAAQKSPDIVAPQVAATNVNNSSSTTNVITGRPDPNNHDTTFRKAVATGKM